MEDKYSTFSLVHAALSAPWHDHGSGALVPRRLRLFYRIKAALCLLLNREPDASVDLVYDGIVIAMVGGGVQPGSVNGPTVYWGVELKVGIGIVGNWWATLNSVSSD